MNKVVKKGGLCGTTLVASLNKKKQLYIPFFSTLTYTLHIPYIHLITKNQHDPPQLIVVQRLSSTSTAGGTRHFWIAF